MTTGAGGAGGAADTAASTSFELFGDVDRRKGGAPATGGTAAGEQPRPRIYPLMGRWVQCAPLTVARRDGTSREAAPPARSGHSLVAIDGDTLLLFGGGPDENVSNDVYRIDLCGPPGARRASCRYLHVDARSASPFERDRHSAWVWRGHMYIFGGEDVHGYMYSDIWRFNHAAMSWEEKAKRGCSPSPRRGQTCTLVGSTVWLFGGLTFERESVAEVYTLDMATFTFKLQPTNGTPPCGRRGHSATALDGYIYIFGGCDESEELLGDLWRLDLATCTWESVLPYRPYQGPAPSVGHAAAIYRGKLLTFGGNISSVRRASCSEIWLYDLEQGAWSQLRMRVEPKARSYHALVALPDGDVLAFGGWSGFNSMNDMMSITDGCNGSLKHFMAECILKHNVAYHPGRAPRAREGRCVGAADSTHENTRRRGSGSRVGPPAALCAVAAKPTACALYEAMAALSLAPQAGASSAADVSSSSSSSSDPAAASDTAASLAVLAAAVASGDGSGDAACPPTE